MLNKFFIFFQPKPFFISKQILKKGMAKETYGWTNQMIVDVSSILQTNLQP